MAELLLVKVKGFGFKSFWPAVVVSLPDIPQHIKVKANDRQVVKFFNTKASHQYGIAPFKDTKYFNENIDLNHFSWKPKLLKAYTEALEIAAEINRIRYMDKLSDDVLFLIFRLVPWPNRVLLERVCSRWMLVSRRYCKHISTFRIPEYFSHHGNIRDTMRILTEKRQQVIHGITIDRTMPYDQLQEALDMILSKNPDELTGFEYKDIENLRIYLADEMVLVWQKVLSRAHFIKKLDLSMRWDHNHVDLSNQRQLTHLTIQNIVGLNMSSSNLTHLNVTNADGDFMVIADISNWLLPNQEKLVSLTLIRIERSVDYRLFECTFVNLEELRLERIRIRICIDLSMSVSLKHIDFHICRLEKIVLDFSRYPNLVHFRLHDDHDRDRFYNDHVIFLNIASVLEPSNNHKIKTFWSCKRLSSALYCSLMIAFTQNHPSIEKLRLLCLDVNPYAGRKSLPRTTSRGLLQPILFGSPRPMNRAQPVVISSEPSRVNISKFNFIHLNP